VLRRPIAVPAHGARIGLDPVAEFVDRGRVRADTRGELPREHIAIADQLNLHLARAEAAAE
jgi:hypothetical protein